MVLDPRSGVGESSPATRRAPNTPAYHLARFNSPGATVVDGKSVGRSRPNARPDPPSSPFCGKTQTRNALTDHSRHGIVAAASS